MPNLSKQSQGFVESKAEGGQMGVLLNLSQREIGNELAQTIDARELHEFLESKQDFSTWIKNRIEQYGFVDGQDFTRLHKKMEANNATRIEYHISIVMAKELSMVERNEKGRQARQYFIDCERQAKELANRDPMELLNDPSVLRQTLLGYSEKVITLEAKVEEQAPKVEAHDRIADAAGSLSIRETATTLEYPERKLVQWFIQNEWAYRRNGNKNLLAYAASIKKGWLMHRVRVVPDHQTGDEKVAEQMRITPFGLTVLAKKLNLTPPYGGTPPAKPNAYLEARG